MSSSSVADRIRREEIAEQALLAPVERIVLALELGDEAIALYCATHGVSEAAAREAFAVERHRGRRPCRCNPTAG